MESSLDTIFDGRRVVRHASYKSTSEVGAGLLSVGESGW